MHSYVPLSGAKQERGAEQSTSTNQQHIVQGLYYPSVTWRYARTDLRNQLRKHRTQLREPQPELDPVPQYNRRSMY